MSAGRADAYGLLAQLLRQEVDAAMLEYLRTDRQFRAALPAGDPEAALRQLSAEYARLFCIDLSPYASVFLDDEVLLLTDTSTAVEDQYQASAFVPDASWRVAAPDHVAVEFAYMQALCAAEHGEESAAAREAQACFLVEHLIAWLPALALATRRTARLPFYPLLLDSAVELALDHRNELAPSRTEATAGPSPDPSGGGVPGLAEAALGDVAAFLTTPAHCGLFLAHADLLHIAAGIDVPLGRSSRRQQVRQLFEEAARFEVLSALLAALEQLVRDELAAYAGWSARYPQAQRALQPARIRLQRLQASLHAMETAACSPR